MLWPVGCVASKCKLILAALFFIFGHFSISDCLAGGPLMKRAEKSRPVYSMMEPQGKTFFVLLNEGQVCIHTLQWLTVRCLIVLHLKSDMDVSKTL